MSNQFYQDKDAEAVAKRARKYLKENDALLKKFKLIIRLVISFPKRRNTPLLSKIALWIIAKQGGQLDIEFGEIRKNKI